VEGSTRENKKAREFSGKVADSGGWERKNAREALGFLHRLGRGLGWLDGRKFGHLAWLHGFPFFNIQNNFLFLFPGCFKSILK
jgi:hypothetical protein